MPADLSGEARETGDGTRTYLIASDTHLQWNDDTEGIVDTIEEYSEEYDCDELVLAGDIGAWDDVEAFLESDMDGGYIAGGNHDHWTEDDEDRDVDDYEIGRTLAWQDDETGFRFALSHYPADFGQSPVKDRSSETLGPYDIVIHGHSHMPRDRIVDDSLVLGTGSLYRNYNTKDHLPDRSFHVLELDDGIALKHIDYDSGDIVEEKYFSVEDGIEQTSAVWTWDGDLDDRFYSESLPTKK